MKHELFTLSDVHNTINSENIDNFLKDFEAWLRFGIDMKEVSKKMEEAGIGHIDDTDRGMTWIDDGKIGLSKITVEIKTE